MKAITPIISTTILLLITVAIAGAAWFYVSGFYELYTAKVIDIPRAPHTSTARMST